MALFHGHKNLARRLGQLVRVEMTYINDDFVSRVQRLSEKKSSVSNGFGMTVNGYGEMELCKLKSREFNPKRGLAIVLLVFFGLKGLVFFGLKGVFYNQLGQMTYEGRIGSLE